MSSPEILPAPADEHAPESLVDVGIYPSFADGSGHGLVVLAMGLPYWLEPAGAEFALRVEAATADAVREQLRRFDRECAHWPPTPAPMGEPLRTRDLLLPLCWALAICASFRAQTQWPAWTEAGLLDAKALFRHGEWWRPVTALFLHADAGHLLSNAASGIFVFAAVAATFGTLRGWLLLGLTAAAANVASAAAQFPAEYRSLGASTALFAGLGLLTGRAVRAAIGESRVPWWRALLVPLGAGCTVLAMYGAGEMRVDVGAHACGFALGLLAGLAVPARCPRRDD